MRQAELKKILGQVEQKFQGQSRSGQEAILNRWRYLAAQNIPEVENARAIWEQDTWDPDAHVWRETRHTIEWETQQVDQCAQAVAGCRAHPVKFLILRTGLLKSLGALQQLEQRHGDTVRLNWSPAALSFLRHEEIYPDV